MADQTRTKPSVIGVKVDKKLIKCTGGMMMMAQQYAMRKKTPPPASPQPQLGAVDGLQARLGTRRQEIF